MKFVQTASLDQYSRSFCQREGEKHDLVWEARWRQVLAGFCPVEMMYWHASYKLPHTSNSSINVCEFSNPAEVLDLVLADHIPVDRWMQEKGLVPNPFTNRIGDLARIALDREFFNSHWPVRQISNYHRWKKEGTLLRALDSSQLPLLEQLPDGKLKIIDGWGRFLPIAALLMEDMEFYPAMRTYVASPPL